MALFREEPGIGAEKFVDATAFPCDCVGDLCLGIQIRCLRTTRTFGQWSLRPRNSFSYS